MTKKRGPARLGACVFEQLPKLTALEHLKHDVAATDEFPFHVQLRESGPLGMALECRSQLRIGQHVDGQELSVAGAQRVWSIM